MNIFFNISHARKIQKYLPDTTCMQIMGYSDKLLSLQNECDWDSLKIKSLRHRDYCSILTTWIGIMYLFMFYSPV